MFGAKEQIDSFLEPFPKNPDGSVKTWEQLNFGEKFWGVAQEIPKVLYSFIPPSVREESEKPAPKSAKEFTGRIPGIVSAPFKGAAEFGLQIADITKQGIGGGILQVSKKFGGPEKVTIPGVKQVGEAVAPYAPHIGESIAALEEVSSWGVQKKQLVDQGFSDNEAMALVGINAYLSVVPFAVKGLKSKPGRIFKEKVTTKEVPFSETPEGIRASTNELTRQSLYGTDSQKTVKAFGESKNQTVVGKLELGDFGRKSYENKLNQKDRFPISELEHTQNYITDAYKASTNPRNYRSDNVAWVAKMPDGEVRVIYTRLNKNGAEEILNWHRVSDERFVPTLQSNGIPDGSRTRIFSLERSRPNPLGYKDTENVTYNVDNSNMVRVERPIVTATKKVFGKTKEQQDFNTLLQEHLDTYFESRSALLGREDPLNQALLKLNDVELKTYSNVTQGLTTLAKPSANLTQAVELWRKTNKEIEADLVGRGKITVEQAENRRWKPVEATTGRSRAELKEMGVEPIYYPYLAEELLRKSDFVPSTGRRTKGGYLKRFTGKMLAEDSYIKNPKIAIPRNRMQVFKDKMNSELVDTIRDRFAEQDKALIKKLKTDPRLADRLGLEEWKPSGSLRFFSTEKGVGVTKNVETYWIPEGVAKQLNRFYKPSALEKTLRMTYDPLIDLWRLSVLSLAPRWLYNNVMGNIILSTLGKTDPFAFGKAGKEMFGRTKYGQKLGISTREIPKGVLAKEYAGGEMAKAGQLGSLAREQTQFLRPIENWLNLLEQAKQYKALRIPAAATQKLITGYIALGKPIGYLNKVAENWFRAAVYISKTEGKFLGLKLDKPVPPAEGLRYVNEFLFDYTKLSRLERMTFRRALPFWNWTKNITEFAFKFPVNHPIRGLVVGALLQDYVDYINEENQADDKTRSVLRIKTGLTYEGKPMYLNVKSSIPFSDVFRVLPTNFAAFGRFLTSNPVSKIIIERAFRINSFTGDPFTQPSELQEFDEYGKPILPLPSLGEHLGQQLPQVKLGQQISDTVQYGKVLKRYETGEPKLVRGRIQTSDLLMEILGYFGIRLNPTEYNKIKQSVDRIETRQEVKANKYERQLESGLNRLKNQQLIQ